MAGEMLEMTREKAKALRAAYNQAVRSGVEAFEFDGHELLTDVVDATILGTLDECPRRGSMKKRLIEVVDATILGTLDECPRKGQYAFAYGARTRGEHRALDFGKAYHEGVSVWYKSGKSLPAALEAFNAAYASYVDEGDGGEDEDESREVRTYAKGHELLTARARLFQNEDWDWLGGEQQFVLDIPGCPYRYAGFIDGFGREKGGAQQYVIDEEKTSTSPWLFVANPNAQVTGYVYAARSLFHQDIRRGLLTMAGIYKSSVDGQVKGKRRKKGDPEPVPREVVNRETIDLNPWDLEEWEREVRGKVLNLVSFQGGWDWWPKRTRSCSNYGGCPYRPICQAPPGLREEFLESNFEQSFWSPLDERR